MVYRLEIIDNEPEKYFKKYTLEIYKDDVLVITKIISCYIHRHVHRSGDSETINFGADNSDNDFQVSLFKDFIEKIKLNERASFCFYSYGSCSNDTIYFENSALIFSNTSYDTDIHINIYLTDDERQQFVNTLNLFVDQVDICIKDIHSHLSAKREMVEQEQAKQEQEKHTKIDTIQLTLDSIAKSKKTIQQTQETLQIAHEVLHAHNKEVVVKKENRQNILVNKCDQDISEIPEINQNDTHMLLDIKLERPRNKWYMIFSKKNKVYVTK